MSETVPEQQAAPVPQPDVDSAFYWAGLREHRLLLQECEACGRRRFPPMPACPYCADPRSHVAEASGRAKVYSWIVVHHAFQPAFASQVPYTILTVDLEEGPRMVARLEGDSSELAAGLEGTITYIDHEKWTEPRFRFALR